MIDSPPRSIEEVRRGIPARLFKRNTIRGIGFLIRDIVMAAALWRAAEYIDPLCSQEQLGKVVPAGKLGLEVIRWTLWAT